MRPGAHAPRPISRLAVFGSVLREDFSPDSDVDALVEFEPACAPGFAFIAMQRELAHLLARKVDLHTPASLGPHFRDEILREARVLYGAAWPHCSRVS